MTSSLWYSIVNMNMFIIIIIIISVTVTVQMYLKVHGIQMHVDFCWNILVYKHHKFFNCSILICFVYF